MSTIPEEAPRSENYRQQLLEMLDWHLNNDPRAEVFTEKQATVLSMLQFLFDMNPDTTQLTTQEHLHLRSICAWCRALEKLYPRGGKK